jgi:hypothetical protein
MQTKINVLLLNCAFTQLSFAVVTYVFGAAHDAGSA